MSRGNPQPWFRPSRNTFYATINGVQKNLYTPDNAEAIRRWHELMSRPAQPTEGPQVAVLTILGEFAEWTKKHRSMATYDWGRRFLESFAKSIPRALTIADLKPFHVTRWLDSHPQWEVRPVKAIRC